MRLIDTHAHVNFPEFDKTRKEVVERADREGVGIVDCCLDAKGWAKIEPFQKHFEELFITIGCTPYNLQDFDTQYRLIREHADRIVAVGEIGLDYYWVKEQNGRAAEKENFLKLLALAKELDKPVLIHSRNAESPAMGILEKQGFEKVIMHCFSGTWEEAKRAIDLGYLISIPTNVTRSEQKQDLAKRVPLESIVLETDAPYLAPEPRTVNEPANVVISAKKIAALKGISFEDVARQTTKNARGLFRI